MMYTPTPEEFKTARLKAGKSRAEAAEMMGFSHFTRVGEVERGEQKLDQARWELFQIKCGIHPQYGPLARPKR